jgi:hypothetical protein
MIRHSKIYTVKNRIREVITITEKISSISKMENTF